MLDRNKEEMIMPVMKKATSTMQPPSLLMNLDYTGMGDINEEDLEDLPDLGMGLMK
jgi:hypothetical protein